MPNARTTDPITSKRAAVRTRSTLPLVQRGVLDILSNNEALTGNTINQVYAEEGYTRCAWDSPRKRAGELLHAGYLRNVARSGSNETVYAITDMGLEKLRAAS